MKTIKGQVPGALDRPDPAIRFYLFSGPDESGSRALAIRLLKGLGDAEKFIVLGNAIKLDPASLADEAGAMALFGGPRAIWIEPAGDEIVDGVQALLDAPGSESAVIALAGNLRKTSALLKLAENHPSALCHISYVPEGRDMDRLVTEIGRTLGLRIEPDVAQRLSSEAGSNQAIIAQELTKFALYLGAFPDSPLALGHDVLDAVGAESAEGDWLKLGDLALSGRMDALLEELGRMPASGSETIPVLRSLQRRLLMLAPLRARVEHGEQLSAVMASMGKALFWKDKSSVQRMLTQWSAARLAEAAKRVGELEQQLMFVDLTADAALGETLVSFARVASRR